MDGFVPDVTAWSGWRPEDVARRFAGMEAPWCVAAGWAISLFLGYEHREHEDLEVAVPMDRFGEVAGRLDDCEFFVVGDGMAWPLVDAGEQFETHHQTWAREISTGLWRLDVFREPTDGETWICRRDERVRMPLDRLILRTAEGIPYARPEVTLLFKAKHARPKDDGDLAVTLPKLDPEARRWLVEAMELVHPGHRWLAEIKR